MEHKTEMFLEVLFFPKKTYFFSSMPWLLGTNQTEAHPWCLDPRPHDTQYDTRP